MLREFALSVSEIEGEYIIDREFGRMRRSEGMFMETNGVNYINEEACR